MIITIVFLDDEVDDEEGPVLYAPGTTNCPDLSSSEKSLLQLHQDTKLTNALMKIIAKYI